MDLLDSLISQKSNSNWLNVAQASKELNVTTTQLHSGRADGTVPDWMEKRGRYWMVDINSSELQGFLGGKVKKSNQAKKGHDRKSDIDVDDLEDLKRESIRADLEQPIVKLQFEKYKTEEAKIKLQIKSGELISRQLSEFLYTGYLSRFNSEMLQYQKKLEPLFEQLVTNVIVQTLESNIENPDPKEVSKSISKTIAKETMDIIRIVKQSQLDNIAKWREEEGLDV